MNPYEYEQLKGIDFADEMLRAIEKDYGRTIMKIPKFRRVLDRLFNITIIFTDYTLLEAEISVVEIYGMPAIKVQGTYF